MFVNLNENKKTVLLKKNLKKKYYFHSLICLKSRIKFKAKNRIFLMKMNNNMSMLKKSGNSVNMKIMENKIFLYSSNMKEMNKFIKTVSMFCKPTTLF